MTQPFMIGETIPGYCGGNFPLDTMDDTLRVEAVGVDWIVLRDTHNNTHFYQGSHDQLRQYAYWQRHNNTRRESYPDD